MTGGDPSPGKALRTTRRRGRRDLPIAVILSLVIGAACLVSTIVVYLAVIDVARDNTRELAGDKARITIRTVERHIRSHLDPIREQVAHVVATIDREGLSLDRPQALSGLFAAALAATPQVAAIALSDPRGHILRTFRRRPGARPEIRDWSDDARFAATLAQVRGSAAPFWGDLFIAESVQQPFINFLAPVRRGGAFAGMVIASVSVVELSRFLSGFETSLSGTPFILYDREHVIAHPRLPAVLASLSDERPLPLLAAFGDDRLALIWREPNLEEVARTFSNDVSVRAVATDAGTEVFLFHALPGYGPTPWIVGAHMALSEIAPQLARLDRAFTHLLVALALGVVAALLLSIGLSRPIRQLGAIAERLEDLELDDVPAPRRGLFRELNLANEAMATAVTGLRLFARHVPRTLVRRLLHETAGGRVESEEREVTVLFTDMVGFTAIAEKMTAAQVAAFLNRHLTLINGCIERQGGTTDKYVGDSLMAFWGAPERQSDHALRACRAAIDIARTLRADNERRARKGLRPIRLRIGIHTGRVVVGEIGAPSRVNYTIVGDTVNTAERLEEIARDFAGPDAQVCALVGDETARQVAGALDTRSLGTHTLPGRRGTLEVFVLELGDA